MTGGVTLRVPLGRTKRWWLKTTFSNAGAPNRTAPYSPLPVRKPCVQSVAAVS